jgi:monoamine oxidase
MAKDDTEVAIIGGGAAGVAAARRLHDAGVDCLIVEARERLGGRAWTVDHQGAALDLGCGWLHSADRNPWVEIARAQGLTIDETPPPWMRSSLGFRGTEQNDFSEAMEGLYERVAALARAEPDTSVAAALGPGGRWKGLLGAVITFISGAEPAQVSARDFDNYDNSEVNWRVVEGYGAAIAGHGKGVPAALGCQVARIDHGGKRLKIETAKGAIAADRAIVTLPTSLLAEAETLFAPALPEKMEAARNLPLGLNDKLFIALDRPEEFEANSRLFGHKNLSRTAAYHIRPFGRPMIEAFFGGALAVELEAAGEGAFFDLAVAELTDRLGNGFATRLKPIRIHRWGADPLARGAYSYALPGMADCRATLAAAVDGRLFFAGEACSIHDYSTAHGAFLTGIAAVAQMMKVRTK